MSNPLEREQQPQQTIDLINNASSDTQAENRVTHPSAHEEARERFFKQFEGAEEDKKPAGEDVSLAQDQLEDGATIDLTESIKQAAKAKAEQEPNQDPEKSGAEQSRAERKKRLKEEEQLIEKNRLKETENVTSREAMRKKEQETTKKWRVRVFPIWLRLIVIVVLCVIALVGGAMIGYGIIGKGNPLDVFDIKTWTHIRDIIYLKK